MWYELRRWIITKLANGDTVIMNCTVNGNIKVPSGKRIIMVKAEFAPPPDPFDKIVAEVAEKRIRQAILQQKERAMG